MNLRSRYEDPLGPNSPGVKAKAETVGVGDKTNIATTIPKMPAIISPRLVIVFSV